MGSYSVAMSLERFIQAQEKSGSYERALEELKAGRKTGHWIWWVFPQLKGLGTSHNSTYYGLDNEDEARAYIQRPVLGARYRECVGLVSGHLCQGGVASLMLMGSEIDVIKLRSSVALFLGVTPTSDEAFHAQAGKVMSCLKLLDSN
jgi:uncharacterized protein (DUF1810 family)